MSLLFVLLLLVYPTQCSSSPFFMFPALVRLTQSSCSKFLLWHCFSVVAASVTEQGAASLPSYHVFASCLLVGVILPWSYGHLVLQMAATRAWSILYQEENGPCSRPAGYCVPCCAPHIHDGVSACGS
jgi:hypothetical protein